MRIISGRYKGKRITAPKKLPVRPTTDMAKEALFNILNNQFYFQDLAIIDLFSGTGNISYEFASRGTQDITSVDMDSSCIQFISKTSKELRFDITAIKSDVFKFLGRTQLKADIIFADPPYNFNDEQFARISLLVFENELLLEGGTLIVEHSERTDLSDLPNYSESRKYGGNVFSFFED